MTTVSHMMEAVSASVMGVSCWSSVLPAGVGALVVEGMPQLVGDGADLVERAVEVAQHAAFLDDRNTHAERSAALAVALFGVDPVSVEGAFGER